MAKKAIITDYPGDVRVMSNVRNNIGIPFFNENDTITATRVTTWYDGTPMDDSKADGKVYLKHTSSGEYYLVNLPNWGETFLQKPNVDALRNMSSTEILLIRIGYYKGVSLLGYYAEEGGDTPAPIQYYLSETEDDPDGGSVFEVGGVKLEHKFIGEVDVSYFGVIKSTVSQVELTKLENYCYINNLTLQFGSKDFTISDTVNIRCETSERGCTINVIDNPSVALAINQNGEILFNKEFRLPNVSNANKPSLGYEGVGDGVKVFDLNTCRIYTKRISDFNNGLFVSASNNRGCSYNTFFVGHHLNNKNNIMMNPEGSGGWCNENQFIGGRLSKLSHETNGGKVIRVDVVDGGNGYTNAQVTTSGGGAGTGFSANPVITNGAITSIEIVSEGSGYTPTFRALITGDGQGAVLRGVVAEPESTHIRMLENSSGSAGGVDNNLFSHVSIEGNNVDRHLYCEGVSNVFLQCRWEAIRPNAHFVRRSNSAIGGSSNEIFKGYGVEDIYISQQGGGIRWNVVNRNSRGENIESFNQSFRLRSSNGTSVIRIYGSIGNFMNRSIVNQADNSWSGDIAHSGIKGKRLQDLYPRVNIDFENGRYYVGTGENEVVPFISSGNGSPEGVVFAPVGSLYMNRLGAGSTGNNLYVKTTASNYNDGWILSNYIGRALTNRTGVVQQVVASADTATQAVGDTPTKAEFDALLAELRDLKTKMRAGSAPILAS